MEFSNQPFKKPLISDLNCFRKITSIIVRLRTNRFKGMKPYPDGRSLINCNNSPDIQLSPECIFDCRDDQVAGEKFLTSCYRLKLTTCHWLKLYHQPPAISKTFIFGIRRVLKLMFSSIQWKCLTAMLLNTSYIN